jgi:hypothetical protein
VIVLQTIEFLGTEFAIADKVGRMPLLRVAHAAKSGLDSADMEGMAALYDILRQSIADEAVYVFRGEQIDRKAYNDLPPEAVDEVTVYGGWDQFEEHATKTRADDEDLLGLVQRVMEKLTNRPTKQPSDSSAGLPSDATRSTGDSSSLAVVRNFVDQERPDLAMAVVRAQTA